MIAKNKFKTIEKTVHFDSHFCIEYLNNEGAKLEDSFHRLGLIVMLTSTDKKICSKVLEWKNKLKNILDDEVSSLSKMKQIVLDKNESLKLPEVSTPDSYSYTFSIQHPIAWGMIDTLKTIDLEVAEIENLWLAGVVSDEEKSSFSSKARNILRVHSSKIFKATSPGKRNGGRFNVGQFLTLLRGGLELYVDEKDLDELVKNKQLKNSESTKVSSTKGPKNLSDKKDVVNEKVESVDTNLDVPTDSVEGLVVSGIDSSTDKVKTPV